MIKIDGWTDADVKYMWKLPDPVQMADNLLLPGGFELANYTDDRCDIKTSTGTYIFFFQFKKLFYDGPACYFFQKVVLFGALKS